MILFTLTLSDNILKIPSDTEYLLFLSAEFTFFRSSLF